MNDLTSATLTLDNNSKLFRGLDTHEIPASGNSNEDSLGNYLKYGIGDSAVSAGVGLLNTTYALAESIGAIKSGHQIDEYNAINSLMSADAASFYDRHKVGVDTAGFIGGSLLPGMASIKVLKFAQTAGKISTGLEAATGLRNADLVMNSPAVEAAKKFALDTTTATPNWLSGPMIKAYAQGFKQQLMEATAFETGNLIFNNQNATINPDDLGYFTAIGDQYWDGLKFSAFGGVLGGAVDSLRIIGAVRKFGSEEWSRTAEYNTLQLHPNFDKLSAGSQLMDLGAEAARRAELAKTITPTDYFARRQFEAGEAQLKSTMLQVFKNSNQAGNAGLEVLDSFVKEGGTAQLESMSTILSGMQNVENVSVKDLEELQAFYRKTRSPIAVVSGDSGVDIATQLADEQLEFMSIAKNWMGDAAINKTPYTSGRYIQLATPSMDSSVGLAGTARFLKSPANAKVNVRLGTIDGQTTGIFPDYISINNESLAASYQLTKTYNTKLGRAFTLSEDDYREYVIMHELGHVKNNPEKMLTLIQNSYHDINKVKRGEASMSEELKNTKGVIEDLITASVRSRENTWTSAAGPNFAKLSEKEKVAVLMNKFTTEGQAKSMSYLGNPAELLADGVSYITRKDTREIAAKDFPRLAKMFDEQGAVAKAWSPTKAYYNSRTKEVYSSYLPGIRDVDPAASISTKGMEHTLVSGALGKSYQFHPNAFSDEVIEAGLTKKLDYMDYDANWIMADALTAKSLVSKEGQINVTAGNLPVMEKLHQLYNSGDKDIVKAFENGNVKLGGVSVTAESLAPLVVQAKEEIRRKLAISGIGYNEHEIAKILNIDMGHAIGDLSADPSTWMLLGTKDYTKPELFAFNYAHRNIGDYQGAVMNMTGVSMINDAVKAQVQATAAELTGSLYSKLVDIPEELLATVNPFNSRAGLVNNTRAEMRSLRERATYIGKQVAEHIGNLVQKTDSSFISHSSKLNARENVAGRFELANIDNLLKREHYYLANTEDGKYIIRKNMIGDAMDSLNADLAEQGLAQLPKFSSEMLQNLPKEILDRLDTNDAWAPGAVKLSDDVADFYTQHQATNASLVDRKTSLARVNGRQTTLDPNVLYSPPRDLRQSKYFGFVLPSVFKEGADSRRFMIFGETEAEYEAKKLAIQQKYGADYRVLTKQDVAEFNALKDEYSQGNIFDEIDFDAGMMNRGRASELAPNIDVNFSATLDRYRVWTIRQEEALARAGVELKYDGMVQQLKRMDKHYGNTEASTLDKTYQEASTIWKDTLGTMLNKRSRGSNLESQWVRVNDYLGDKGSAVVEKILSGFKVGKSGTIDQAQLDEMNRNLAAAGYKSPFDGIAEVMLSSPDTQQSKAFPAAVRTMSNLVSTLMLRLDPCNSMIQLIATPILTLPVLQEAKLALRGTEEGQALKNLTTVVNPATGMAEPTAAKMMAKAVGAYFTEDGKAFLAELRSRNIVKDHLSQYLTALDMAQLNGRHTMAEVNHKIDQLAKYGSKVSRHDWAEDFSRFVVAHATKQIADIRGVGADEMWSLVNGAVDKVHGVYAGAQRPQLFQGVLGQSVGLFQTYFFNYAQNMLKYVADANKKQAVTLAGMQGATFGLQSFPGFSTLNQTIGNNAKDNQDLYSVTNADDPKSYGAYAMYGLASTMFGQNVDFATRGSLAARNMLIIPTQFKDLPIVGTLSKAVGNMIETAQLTSDPNVPAARALLHGLAHNGMNRPLGGLATIAMGDVDTNQGQINWQNSNHKNYAVAEDMSWGAMFARAIGTRPLNETIVQNAYFREAGYKANMKREQQELSAKIQLNLADGSVSPMGYEDFAREYEESGGEIQSFNAYYMRQLKGSGNGKMQEFQDQMMKGKDSGLSRSSTRMELKQTKLAPWDTDY